MGVVRARAPRRHNSYGARIRGEDSMAACARILACTAHSWAWPCSGVGDAWRTCTFLAPVLCWAMVRRAAQRHRRIVCDPQ